MWLGRADMGFDRWAEAYYPQGKASFVVREGNVYKAIGANGQPWQKMPSWI